MGRLGELVMKALASPEVPDHLAALVQSGVRTALDVGCGDLSPLAVHRPDIVTVGVDSDGPALERARRQELHDHYLQGNFDTFTNQQLCAPIGGRKFDLVGCFGVIEHLPKHQGFELLRRMESLSARYVIVDTPNGFVPQGPEYGNEAQRHLSGWFREEFEGHGYSVYGVTGTNIIRGYAAMPKHDFRYWALVDAALARALRTASWTRFSFGLVAIKDVRGVPARLGDRLGSQPSQDAEVVDPRDGRRVESGGA